MQLKGMSSLRYAAKPAFRRNALNYAKCATVNDVVKLILPSLHSAASRKLTNEGWNLHKHLFWFVFCLFAFLEEGLQTLSSATNKEVNKSAVCNDLTFDVAWVF